MIANTNDATVSVENKTTNTVRNRLLPTRRRSTAARPATSSRKLM